MAQGFVLLIIAIFAFVAIKDKYTQNKTTNSFQKTSYSEAVVEDTMRDFEGRMEACPSECDLQRR